MAAPTIPASSTQAVQTTGGGTTPFTMAWYNFFAGLLSFVTTGPLGPIPLIGVTDGSNAAAGNVGEYLSTIVPFGSAITLSSNVATPIASLALTAGDWDLDGEMFFGFPVTMTTTLYIAWLANTNSTTFPGTAAPGDGFDYGQAVPDAGTATGSSPASFQPYTINGLRTRVSINAPATYFLMGYITFTGTGTMKGYGALRARRMR